MEDFGLRLCAFGLRFWGYKIIQGYPTSKRYYTVRVLGYELQGVP